MYDTRTDLSISIREKVVPILQARLADCVDLFTQVKQAHWNVKGPHFIALHELFDNIAARQCVSVSIWRPGAAMPPRQTFSRRSHAPSTSNCG